MSFISYDTPAGVAAFRLFDRVFPVLGGYSGEQHLVKRFVGRGGLVIVNLLPHDTDFFGRDVVLLSISHTVRCCPDLLRLGEGDDVFTVGDYCLAVDLAGKTVVGVAEYSHAFGSGCDFDFVAENIDQEVANESILNGAMAVCFLVLSGDYEGEKAWAM